MASAKLDGALILKAQRGDKTAFDILVRKYQYKVFSLIWRFVHNEDTVLDIAQDVFIRAYKGLHTFRGDSEFYTWLYRIAVNTTKNYLQTNAHQVTSDGVDLSEAEQQVGDEKLKDYESPERLLMRDQMEDRVFRVLEHLPEELRTAIILREMEGLSYEEIAEIMDCPVGTVRSRIFRAREAIDKEIDPLLYGGN